MRFLLTLSLCAVVALAAAAPAAPAAQSAESAQSDESAGPAATGDPAGRWSGGIELPNGKLAVNVTLAHGAEAGWSGTIDIPAQGLHGFALSAVAADGGRVHFEMAGVPGTPTFDGELADSGGAIAGTFQQSGRSLPFQLERAADSAETVALKRPQTPRPPFPYQSRDVTFRNDAAGITLAGTVLTPDGPGPFPAVVFVTGSGPQDRDEALMGHRPFLVIADALARRGIASLRYDDRGVGGSGGDHLGSTVDDFAGDAEAAVTFLAAQPKIDPKAVGILGHSEGGLIGPKVAAHGSAVDFLVLLAPPGEPLPALLQRQARALAKLQGVHGKLIDDLLREQEKNLELIADPSIPTDALRARLRAWAEARRKKYTKEQLASFGVDDASTEAAIQQGTSPWFRSLMREDPAVALRQVKVPVLALFGTKDFQVDAEVNSRALRTALDAAGDEDVTIHVFPGLNHLFQHAETGSISEYGQIEETISPEVLAAIGDWIDARYEAQVERR